MYVAFFGLKQEPFSIAPDPRLLFMSDQHREALAHLLYGVQGGGGFVLLTGEIGTGKTTVCRSFLEQVPPHVNLAYIFNPKLSSVELLETICHEFGIAVKPATAQRAATAKDHVDALNAFLLQLACRRAQQRAGHRRSAEPVAQRARAAAPAHQPGNQRAQAAADHPDRPARAARHARPVPSWSSSRNA
jgi:hypothetical protein